MVEHRLRKLRNVVEAVELSRCFPRTVDRRQRQTDQRAQNGDHNQQLDKREALPCLPRCEVANERGRHS